MLKAGCAPMQNTCISSKTKCTGEEGKKKSNPHVSGGQIKTTFTRQHSCFESRLWILSPGSH